MIEATLIVPCFDEEQRLEDAAVLTLADEPGLRVVLVDDGSRDGTHARLVSLAARRPGRVEALRLPRNVGKGEAIRAGLGAALAAGATVVGFADADFSTPPHEVIRLLRILERARDDGSAPLGVVMGSRVARLGARVQRSAVRHGLGRVFATLAALALDAQVYDTQCGAKWLTVSPALAAALATPFRSRWAFDLELLLRLVGRIDGPAPAIALEAILEVPVETWSARPGSKLDVRSMAQALAEVLALLGRARLSAKFGGVVTPDSPPGQRRDV